jgi:putative oxidoreductase
MAGSLIIIMTGAFFVDHVQHGFFMDWFGVMNGEGFEFDILVIGLALTVVISGSGAYSVDNWLFQKLYQKRKTAIA